METLKNVEGLGWYWLPHDPENKVPGTLEFREDGNCTRRLTPDNPVKALQQAARPYVIHGRTPGGNVTLTNCQPIPGGIMTRVNAYNVVEVVAGEHLLPHEARFARAVVRLDGLESWVGKYRLPDADPMSDPRTTQQFALHYLAPEEASNGAHTLRLHHGYRGTIGSGKLDLSDQKSIEIVYTEPGDIDQVMQDVVLLESLLTLAAQGAVHASSVSLHEAGSERRTGLRLWRWDFQRGPSDKPRRPYDWLFTYEGLGGIKSLLRWFDWCHQYGAVVGLTTSVHDKGVHYVENRITNITTALESYHENNDSFRSRRLSKGEQRSLRKRLVEAAPTEHQQWLDEVLQYADKKPLEERLRELMEHAGTGFKAQFAWPDHFCKDLKDHRNGVVHTGQPKRNASPLHLHDLAIAAQLLLVWCMVRDISVDEAPLEHMESSLHFRTWRSNHSL